MNKKPKGPPTVWLTQIFLSDYRASLGAIDLTFEAMSFEGRVLEFVPAEREELKQDIALHWMRYYLGVSHAGRISSTHRRGRSS